MAGQEMPRDTRTEIIDLLQTLKGVWPQCRTINYPDIGNVSDRPGNVERYIRAVQWLTDRGLISFEAMMVDTRGLSIIDSSLTPRGREYSGAYMATELSGRSEN